MAQGQASSHLPQTDQSYQAEKPSAGLAQLMQQIGQSSTEAGRKIPPLAQWNPQFCGHMDLVIRDNGEWWHEGQLIRRQALVDLFSSVLWKEDDQYYLKTPVEKILIQVDDAPLLITQIDAIDIDGMRYIECRTPHQDIVRVDAAHPIFLREYRGQLRPYIRVRDELDALIQRSAFYHMLNLGEFDETNGSSTRFRIRSGMYECCLAVEGFDE